MGAISGGGGNSRLLIDYPESQRNQILDYLFKPGYGAALQILKLEIGGDANTTDGAEPSIEHSRGKINCDAGYEFWLAQEAKRRNPDIKLAGLTWAAPGWLNAGDNDFYTSPGTISYLMDWMTCAKQKGLTIDYLGGWNERYPRNGSDAWYKKLRSRLDAEYPKTKVIGGENDWSIAGRMMDDPGLKNAVDVMGLHYPCGYQDAMANCADKNRGADYRASQKLIEQGKTLWASENGSQDYDKGAPAVARAINRGYIDSKMTAYINWPVVASLYQNLHFSKNGLVLADQPWSGAYDVGPTAWVMAHTAQFAQPGWKYVDGAGGYLGGDRANGSYVTLKSPDAHDFSTVIETMDATAGQTASFTVRNLPADAVHVWATDVRSFDARDAFAQQPDIKVKDGGFTITLKPGYVYSLTTTTGQGRGTAASPARADFPKTHADDFERDKADTGQQARYLSAMNGAFEVVTCTGEGHGGNCLRQEATGTPVRWTDENYSDPYALIGDLNWKDYTVSSDVMLEEPGHVEVMGRIGQQGRNNNGLQAYLLQLTDEGEWAVRRSEIGSGGTAWKFTTLTSGKLKKEPGTMTWHHLALSFRGAAITASVDGTVVGEATDSSYPKGQAGLGSGWTHARYDNFKVTVGGGDPAGACSAAPAWTRKNYQAGDVVSRDGSIWKAQWWANPNNEPGTPSSWGAWKQIGTC
ncbi:galactosylceramidase [Streptomyces actinomycinicus]|uniref:galactosylceramidase n=1 Tax=Streptomyces actinomycinicus TaxID=1695166 RepID=A0A937EP86_9ACTN|nr:galactosylceramidase [Streptomyces actinomycinicus]MBL1086988.1 galactosylceramidase [Streptomyces actinomycinicus]